jgi:hypothetical protein
MVDQEASLPHLGLSGGMMSNILFNFRYLCLKCFNNFGIIRRLTQLGSFHELYRRNAKL